MRGVKSVVALVVLWSGCTTVYQSSCGPGTERVGEVCLGSDAGMGLRCGPGTVEWSGECVALYPDVDGGIPPDASPSPSDAAVLRCGLGTHRDGDLCVPDTDPGLGYWDLRTPTTTISADGYSLIPLFAIGRETTGEPFLGEVVLTVSRASAGVIDPPRVTLSSVGGTTYFRPCSSADPGCVGTFDVSLERADMPGVVLTTTGPLELVAPAGVGTLAPCMLGGNVIFYDGDTLDYIFPGRATIRAGTWYATAYTGSSPSEVSIHVDPSDSGFGLWWDLRFSSTATGVSLREQPYEDAERAPFASPGHPGIDIGGDGRGCNSIRGRFQIHDLTMSGSRLTRFAATFEQHCEGGAPALRGCVIYEE